jgi:hypothetical protein
MFRNKPEARLFLGAHMALLRERGLSFEQIGRQFGYTASGARRFVRWSEKVAGLEALPRASCHACGTPFTRSRAGARYCSNACRQDAYRHRRAGRLGAE